jgi:hypothetical protein
MSDYSEQALQHLLIEVAKDFNDEVFVEEVMTQFLSVGMPLLGKLIENDPAARREAVTMGLLIQAGGVRTPATVAAAATPATANLADPANAPALEVISTLIAKLREGIVSAPRKTLRGIGLTNAVMGATSNARAAGRKTMLEYAKGLTAVLFGSYMLGLTGDFGLYNLSYSVGIILYQNMQISRILSRFIGTIQSSLGVAGIWAYIIFVLSFVYLGVKIQYAIKANLIGAMGAIPDQVLRLQDSSHRALIAQSVGDVFGNREYYAKIVFEFLSNVSAKASGVRNVARKSLVNASSQISRMTRSARNSMGSAMNMVSPSLKRIANSAYRTVGSLKKNRMPVAPLSLAPQLMLEEGEIPEIPLRKLVPRATSVSRRRGRSRTPIRR